VSQGPYDPQRDDPQRGPEDEGHGYGRPQQPAPPPQDYGYGQAGQSGQQPTDYGYGYGYGQPAPPPQPGYGPYDVDTGATLALILSIVALVICPPGSIVTLILSNNATRKIQQTGKYQDAGMAKAGKVISIIGIVLFALSVLAFVLFGIIGALASGVEGSGI
jgi:Domain of unknown function (DUF4190)